MNECGNEAGDTLYRVKILMERDESFSIHTLKAPDIATACATALAEAQASLPDYKPVFLTCYPDGGQNYM